MLRRHLLLSAAALPLAACAGSNPDQVAAIVARDVNIIAAGLKGVLPQLALLNIPRLTPSILTAVGGYVGNIQEVAVALSGAPTNAAAQPLVQKVETYLNAIVAALAGLPLPPPVQTALVAASILLPVIETAVGLIVPVATPPAAADTARAALSVTAK